MIGLDTNILLRLAIQDDPEQMQRARRFVAQHCSAESPGFVNRISLCEMVWVLESRYKIGRADVAQNVANLLFMSDIIIEDADIVRRALARYEQSNVEFSDLLTAESNLAAGCSATATFDKRARKLAGFVAVR